MSISRANLSALHGRSWSCSRLSTRRRAGWLSALLKSIVRARFISIRAKSCLESAGNLTRKPP